MRALHPHVDPDAEGMLDVGDGQLVHWEASGDRDGIPALVLHGGPGSGCAPGMRRFFDPARYRVVLLDQRQCGRSTPAASDPETDLAVNTTHHLVRDIDVLRLHLGVERWALFGMSWGSTLALVYAQQHPAHVLGIVLEGVATSTRAEIDWLYRGAAAERPEEWAQLVAALPPDARDDDLVEAYHRLLEDVDPEVRARAAAAFTRWEWSLSSVDRDAPMTGRWADPRFQLGRARIVTHYFRHGCWLADGEVLAGIPALTSLPGILLCGRHDLQTTVEAARSVAAAWPSAELRIVEGAGHSIGDPGMPEAIVAALDDLADRITR